MKRNPVPRVVFEYIISTRAFKWLIEITGNCSISVNLEIDNEVIYLKWKFTRYQHPHQSKLGDKKSGIVCRDGTMAFPVYR